jgi:hypothetical protein
MLNEQEQLHPYFPTCKKALSRKEEQEPDSYNQVFLPGKNTGQV